MSPEMYQLNSCVTVQDHHLVIGGDPSSGQLPAIYIPLLPGGGATCSKTETRSISCQTTDEKQDGKHNTKKSTAGLSKDEKLSKKAAEKQEKSEKKQEQKQHEKAEKIGQRLEKGEKEDNSPPTKPQLERSSSVREKKQKEKGELLTRSASVRYSEDKAQCAVRDINLKTCDLHQDKDKGGPTDDRDVFNRHPVHMSPVSPGMEYDCAPSGPMQCKWGVGGDAVISLAASPYIYYCLSQISTPVLGSSGMTPPPPLERVDVSEGVWRLISIVWPHIWDKVVQANAETPMLDSCQVIHDPSWSRRAL